MKVNINSWVVNTVGRADRQGNQGQKKLVITRCLIKVNDKANRKIADKEVIKVEQTKYTGALLTAINQLV